MNLRSLQTRLARLEKKAKHLERRHQERHRSAVTAIEDGTASYEDFKIVYPDEQEYIEELLERERAKLVEFPFDPPDDSGLLNAGRAYWVIISLPPDEMPSRALFRFRPFVTGRGVRRGHCQWEDYVQANLLLVHLQRWEHINDPTKSGQNWSRADILADRHRT